MVLGRGATASTLWGAHAHSRSATLFSRSTMQRVLASTWCCVSLLLVGCSALPDIVHQPQYHNPFPQLSRVAVLPFYNQSADPTVDGEQVALAYYNELQAIKGFEVVPVGVSRQFILGLRSVGQEPQSPEQFQELARMMGVDVVVVGSITDYSSYYPPRMGMSVRWHAANPSFHPIPPGYGLPWGTAKEEFIPEDLVFETEFALAKEQLKTQTPEVKPAPSFGSDLPSAVRPASATEPASLQPTEPAEEIGRPHPDRVAAPGPAAIVVDGSSLPADWPDPRGLIPPGPQAIRPEPLPQCEPIISHTRLYHGQDAEFTRRLANYYYFRDDARFGGWQGYLQRSEDFTRFCCHLHITEMLAARGGAGETRVVWRWPVRRYER